MTPHPKSFEKIAKQVLAEYDLHAPRLTHIGHSDNLTYRVNTGDGDVFLLRLHIPVTVAMGVHGSNSVMVNSEATWLLALARDTDLTLQRPISNCAGSLVTRFSLDDASAINCTLLSWVEGIPYNRDLETQQTAYQIGLLLGKLHNHASRWEIPDGFNRPRRDRPYFENALNSIYTAVEDERISASDFAVFSHSVSKLIELMAGLSQNRQHYGLMHGDAHKGNMLFDDGTIHVIDFSFCAFGNYMFDLGVCLSDMKPEFHADCLAGYQNIRELPPNYPKLIEAFFIGSMVGTFSFWVDNPRGQEMLARKVPQIAADYATKFNHGERFWFSN